MSRKLCVSSGLAGASLLLTQVSQALPAMVQAPMRCSRGDAGQIFSARVNMPPSQAPCTTFTVRIDSNPSKKLSHFGLNYIHDMTTEYQVPAGTKYVAGSARIVPETGTANVRSGARVAFDGARLRMQLPAHIANGSSYTPPSVEFDLAVDAPLGTNLALKFTHYEVTANAFLVGEVHSACEPRQPFPIGMTIVASQAGQ